MKICGVIAEYNPFHNGHKYQLEQARKKSGCDFLIAVMGGAMSQRGEVMLLDKWTRTKAALANGADLVVELPALFAVRSADHFARGGVHILSGLKADCISFGCETDDAESLNSILDLLSTEDESLQADIRAKLSEGKSHVRARGEAAAQRLGISADMLSQPNTALALEYMRVNRSLQKPMDVHIVRREGGYHDAALSPFASASAIRAAVKRGNIAPLADAMPPYSFEMLKSSLGGGISDMSRLDALLIDRLRTSIPEALASLCDVSEGLENRVLKCVETAGSREALLAALKCKRYTYARLSRLCAHALLGLSREIAQRNPLPRYARVLGFRKDARELLTYLRDASLPLVTRTSVLRDTSEFSEIFAVERRATDLQSLCFADESLRAAGRDLTEKMIIL